MEARLRKEMKYIISREMALEIQKSLEGVLQQDIYSGVNGEYTIRSQYYDSLIDRDLQDNLDGLLEKRKIRIRVYDLEGDSAKLEYKCKSGSDGIKKVISIKRSQAEAIEQGDFSFLAETNRELDLFLYQKMTQYVYRPKSIIEYERRAYIYPVSDTRITFDREIRTATTSLGVFSKDLSFVPLMSGDSIVMEVKYNDFLIEPIKKLVKKHGLLETANSKYSQSRIQMI